MKNVPCYIFIALLALSCMVTMLSSAYFPTYRTMCIAIAFACVSVFIVAFIIVSVANALARSLKPNAPNSIEATNESDSTIGIACAIDDETNAVNPKIVITIHP